MEWAGKVLCFRVSTGREEVGRCFLLMRGFHVTGNTGPSSLGWSAGFSGSGPSCTAHAQDDICPHVGLCAGGNPWYLPSLRSLSLPSRLLLSPDRGGTPIFLGPSHSSHWDQKPPGAQGPPHSSFSRRLLVEGLFCSRNIFRPTAKGLCLKYL